MSGFLLFAACAHPGLPTVAVGVGAVSLTVEVADEEAERSVGLMYRDQMASDAGMLFVYPDELERRFWMKNTRMPLSIAFIDGEGRIVSIADMKPMDTNTTPSGAPAQYALELNVGWFARHGVGVGDRITGLPAPPP